MSCRTRCWLVTAELSRGCAGSLGLCALNAALTKRIKSQSHPSFKLKVKGPMKGELRSQCAAVPGGCEQVCKHCRYLWHLDTNCQSLKWEVTEMQGLWEIGILTEGPVMFPVSTTKGEDIKVEMQKLVKKKQNHKGVHM